jgi:transcription initiation factor IIE alpha subunit
MTFKCTDCKKFMHCSDNSEAWEKAKELYPKTEIDGVDTNERSRLKYIDTVAGRCQERVAA